MIGVQLHRAPKRRDAVVDAAEFAQRDTSEIVQVAVFRSDGNRLVEFHERLFELLRTEQRKGRAVMPFELVGRGEKRLAEELFGLLVRRMANDGRHVRRALAPEESAVALVYLERWLSWYFCHFEFGFKRRGLTSDASEFAWSADRELRELVSALEMPDLTGPALKDLIQGREAVRRLIAVP